MINHKTEASVEAEVLSHSCRMTNDFVHYQSNGTAKRRRKRGKCIICNSNTTHFCVKCPAHKFSKLTKAWCCAGAPRTGQASNCMEIHQNRVRVELGGTATVTNMASVWYRDVVLRFCKSKFIELWTVIDDVLFSLFLTITLALTHPTNNFERNPLGLWVKWVRRNGRGTRTSSIRWNHTTLQLWIYHRTIKLCRFRWCERV